ncbi:LPS-assembly protein LptD [Geobacter benzoatilyticus]|uniref:LPS-assembly protein LptD n=1 Tax=Geobacter benzoatilyticus TaxID=2815309 RepID=A0ABX7Q0C8_9BACT|nr:LPS assembly protein LptD [Geobacter benzoatilyticus]QSV44571.1 LPS-assembly protein LptD [Geobacter benzoatilyticus]
MANSWSLRQLLSISTLVISLPAAALAQPDTGGPVHVEADTLTHEAALDRIEATGSVRISGRGMTLLSDRALLFPERNEAEALGNVTLMSNGDTLSADRLKINYEDETGEVEQGNAFIKDGNFHVRAARMFKLGPDSYRLEDGTFTTCDAERPSWKFSASDVNVTLGEYATGKHALLYLGDVPVFYLPYIIFPVKTERQSGFLVPRTGNTSKKGFTFNMAYYWAIDPSQDSTFNIDIQSKRGVGFGLDYRYIRKRGSEGEFRGYGIYDTEQQRFRGDMSQKHQEIISDTFNIKSDINLTTDRDFYRDFAEQTGVYNRNQLDSTMSVTKRFRRQVLVGEFRYMEDLREDVTDNRKTLQKLPAISLTGVRERLWDSPFFISHESSLTNFYRREGIKGQRLDLHPVLTSYAKPFGAVETSAWAGYRMRFYNAYDVPDNDGNNLSEADGLDGMGLVTAGGAVSSTMARVYDMGPGSLSKIRHVMIPELRYSFVQNRSQEELPFFDYGDRLVHENRVVYSLSNYLTGKFSPAGGGDPEYRELLYLKLSQGYDFSGTRRDLLTLVDEKRPFSDLMLEARVNPVKQISLALDSRVNVYDANISTTAVSADAKDESGNAAGVTYRYARDEVDYLEGRASVSLFKPIYANYAARYSFDRKDFLESLYALEYRHQCWSVIVTYRDRNDTKEFFVNFSLSGLGALGTVRVF